MRAALAKASLWGVRQLCFSQGIKEQHGQRKQVYEAKKDTLIRWLIEATIGFVDSRPDHVQERSIQILPEEEEQKPAPGTTPTHLTTEDVAEILRRSLADAVAADKLMTGARTAELINLATKASVEDVNQFVENQLTDRLPKLVAQELKKYQPTIVILQDPKKKKGGKRRLGLQHKQFPVLLAYISSKCNIYLVGPAGSGKSRAASEAARALKLKFYSESVSQQTPVSIIKGYMDARGSYVGTSFRKAFENGGVFLLDEMDAGNANVITAFNAAVALEPGEIASFPDGMIEKHPDFVCIAAANTIGRGGDRKYVGRNPLDVASLDRFVFIEWDYDEQLERAICRKRGYDDKWVDHVQACRKAVLEMRLRLVISPRASMQGGALLRQGREWEEVEKAVMFKGIDEGTVSKVLAAVSSN